MDRRKYLSLILLLCVILAVHAQPKVQGGFVSGWLKDSISLLPVAYATVRVARAERPSAPVKLTVTDTNGYFRVAALQPGKYTVTLSHVGFRAVSREFSLGTRQDGTELGILYTRETAERLGDVNVTAQRLPIKFEIDKITYDVESDPDARVTSTLDMLRKVPLVTVDGDDNIELNGSGCTIYINGRPSGLMKQKPGKALKGIPATAIRKIEVITSPGAKYDASGTGGIINIEMARGGLEGYSVFVQGNVDDIGKWGVALSGMLKYDKLSASGFFSHYPNYLRDARYNSVLTNLNDTESHNLYSRVRGKVREPASYINAEISYEADSLNLLTFTLSSRRYETIRETAERDEMQREDASPVYRYRATEKSKTNNGGTEATFNYQRTFRKPEQLFTLSYMYNYIPSGGYNHRYMFDFWKDNARVTFSPYDIRDENKARSDEHTVQADYVHPFDTLQTLECGLKYIRRAASSKGIYKRREDSGEAWESLPAKEERFLHVQNIYAAYLTYALKYRKFGLKAGVRLERAALDVALHSRTEPDFDAGFTDVIPSVTFSLQVTPTRVWKVGYNTRVMRPGIQHLNPYRSETNASVVSYGNSRLKSERFHIVSLGFSTFTPAWMINTSVEYRYSGNSIRAYTFMENGRKVNTFGNIGQENSVMLNLFVNANLGGKTSLRVNGNVGYIDLDSREIRSVARGWQYSATAVVQQTLWWGIRCSAYGGYFGSRVRLQYDSDGYYYYALTLNKSFLKDRLTFSCSGNNFADGLRRLKGVVSAPGYIQHHENVLQYRSFNFSLSYRIGNLRATVKKVKRGIVNDDVKREDASVK